MNIYESAASKAMGEVEANPEWQSRYENYAKAILKHEGTKKASFKTFRGCQGISVYTCVGDAKSAAKKFDLRYCGQSIASVHINRTGEIRLKVNSRKQRTNGKNFNYDKGVDCLWNSREATEFRSHIIKQKRNNVGKSNEEHRIENLFLREFSKSRSVNKGLSNIQPVKLFGCFFQMPTVLSASSKDIAYQKLGGGVDILARIGRGKATELCVIELKDENKASEPAEKVMQQAIAYAVFILKLLRSTSGNDWWQLFGFKRILPQSLTINAVVAMPDIVDQPPFIGSDKLPIDQDFIELHYITFNETDGKLANIKTSLELCASPSTEEPTK